MIDGYLEGDVGRTSPEAPVPVVLSKTTRQVAGGAANVANNLRALGANVRLAGLIGDDSEGTRLRALLDESGIEHTLVQDPTRDTTSQIKGRGSKSAHVAENRSRIQSTGVAGGGRSVVESD